MALMDYLPQFSDNTDGSGVDDPTLAQINLKRKLALADSLRNSPVLEGQMVSGRYVRPSWTQALANAVNKGIGMYTEKQAMKEYGDIAKAQEAKKQAGLADLLKTLKNEPTTETTMQPTQVDLQQGMNVPVAPSYSPTSQANEQVSQIYPNYGGQTPIQNMQGQTNVMKPVTTQVPAKPLTQNDILGAVVKYGQTIGDNKIGEGAILDYIKHVNTLKKTTWVDVGDKQIQIDETGTPTGQTLPKGISPSDVLHSKTTIRGQDLINAREKEKLDPYHIFGNTSPANISKQTKSIKLDDGSTINGTLDTNSGKYYVIQNGKKFWIEE